ncbi:ATP-dependent helicase wrn-1-like [Montipora capricornis]|uniref:ATP-dependent helicase wrn-1-like n=1 Tax=Montipora capricornis TaxID=246305 RepID=UPI0035F18BD3
MATFEEAFDVVSNTFRIPNLNAPLKTGIRKIVEEKKDVFVNLPTGFGKSLLYQALPLVFDLTSQEPGHIVVVVSPLIRLMEDQVSHLKWLGLKAVNISSLEEGEGTRVESGEYSLVYESPEAWLKNEQWRFMLTNSVYSKKLCAIAVDEAHVVRQWGTSQDIKIKAFRESYSKLYELRSLAPNVPVAALTATATKLTRDTVFNLLNMKNAVEIKESPNKLNVAYVVQFMDKDMELEFYFGWLTDELKKSREKTERTISYCQTIRQCGLLYATIKALLGEYILIGNDSKHVLVEMLHSCTPEANKHYILESFQSDNGTIRLLIATIGFGMGVDCRGVHRVIHFGPSKNVESYVQETGRAGRDGHQSVAYVLYHGFMLNHIDAHMKSFIKTEECRRKTLLNHFESVSLYPEQPHLCCDNCAAQCKCGMPHSDNITKYPVTAYKGTLPTSKEREVLQLQKKVVEDNLIRYHKSIIRQLVGTAANGNVKTLTNLQFMLGFSQYQISQVLDNLHRIFSTADVCNLVEIWDRRHTQRILSIVSNVFKDINVNSDSLADVNDQPSLSLN